MRSWLAIAIAPEAAKKARARRPGLKRQVSSTASFLTCGVLALLAMLACILLAFILSGPPSI